MTNCDSIFNLLLIFETIHPFSINFASDRKELNQAISFYGSSSGIIYTDIYSGSVFGDFSTLVKVPSSIYLNANENDWIF